MYIYTVSYIDWRMKIGDTFILFHCQHFWCAQFLLLGSEEEVWHRNIK